ncbi:hypothetical protein SAMN04488589_2628 [Methanolobus vulcani]|jgi:hypothetical protein|uniref:Class III signal peptide n=1 Tax=Methanolobus vulcani TaxID=38026 RepID=A0A7Z7B1R1_9EURY|nr:hypothetical protein [Methanolobus vulcani]MDK2826357.1 hypothetical protein [Methanolobus sp.]MDK2948126.1 hypothetical protein [Methanolobus sp.]SDG29669.1 hypothetical protein SAMN04488589_2628 [Methanolobus vulcani]
MDSKGQITIDYLIGIVIFLFAVLFIFNYTSGIFTPFHSNSDEITLIADRTSTALVEKILSEGDETVPNLVNKAKVDILFTEIDTNYDSYIDYLGLTGSYLRYDFNVTMENQTSVMNTAGKVIPPGVNVGQTKRIVLVKNDENGEAEMAIMSFRVW